MRLALISPLTIGLSPREASQAPYGDAPLGVLTLASVARNDGHEVAVFDLDYLSHQINPSRFVTETIERLAETDCEVFGFGSICDSYPLTLQLIRALRCCRPDSLIIMGGPQATVTDLAVLRAVPELDLVVRGEAERILPQLLSAFSAGFDLSLVPGITYRNAFQSCRNADAPTILELDSIPDPAWDLDAILTQRPDASVEMGRGCPFACEFCSTNDFFRRKFRIKSPARVLAQMQAMDLRYGMTKFSLVHDMFTVDRRKVMEFAAAAREFAHRYEWGCSARTDCVDTELLEIMHRGGCRKVFFGVESGSAKLQKSMQKGLDLAHSRQVVEATSELGMRSTVSLIIGFPDEDYQDLLDTADWYMYASRFDRTAVHLHLLSPLAGTPITARFFDSLTLDMTPDCWSGDEEEHLAIATHKDLFVNFYSFKTHNSRHLLRELKHFLRCGTLRCNWLMQALHREGGHIVRVFERFYQPAANRTPDWYRSDAFVAELLLFAAGQSGQGCHPATRLMLEFYRQLLSAQPAAPDQAGASLPALPEGAVLVRCDGDVLAVIEALRAGGPVPDPGCAASWIIVRAALELEGELEQVTPLAGQVLKLCDGSRTASEIGRHAKATGLAPAELPDAAVAEVLLSKLEAIGLVRYAR